MTTGCHIIKAPSGVYTFVGSVPGTLCDILPATRADIMGGRAFHGYKGDLLCASPMHFHTEQSARDFAAKQGETILN